MPRTRIKICGITRLEDAVRAVESGVDFLGLNLVGGPRRLTIAQADAISDELRYGFDIHCKFVALCADSTQSYANSTCYSDVVGFPAIDTLQLYSDDYSATAKKIAAINWWMISQVSAPDSLAQAIKQVQALTKAPAALLLDTAVPGQLGGTGQSFNWHWIAEARAAGELTGLPPIILAGGLNPTNVADAIRIAQPYAVDVSSGVEVPGRPGIKDPAKLRDFIQAVRAADNALAE